MTSTKSASGRKRKLRQCYDCERLTKAFNLISTGSNRDTVCSRCARP